MDNPLKKEIERLAHRILAQEENWDTAQLLEQTELLFKQLIVLDHMEKQSTESQQSSEVAPLMETISELVTELPMEEESAAISELFLEVAEPEFVKKEQIQTNPEEEAVDIEAAPAPPKNLNDVLGKGIQIGLNDRLAFIKNLFDENAEDYQRVLSQVQTYSSWEEAQQFIAEMIKPEYNNWEGRESFEERFLKCIATKFN